MAVQKPVMEQNSKLVVRLAVPEVENSANSAVEIVAENLCCF